MAWAKRWWILSSAVAVLLGSCTSEGPAEALATQTKDVKSVDAKVDAAADVAKIPDGVLVKADAPDTGGKDTYVPKPGEFGAECQKNSECDDSYCIPTADGKVCTKACIEDCPTGWSCEKVSVPGADVQYICVPRFNRLCDPCTSHAECIEYEGLTGSKCIDYAGVGKFCGAICGKDTPCPVGYTCQDVPVEGKLSKQCIPVADTGAPKECACSKAAMELGKGTTCYNTNANGTCYGKRQCTAQGLSPCTAMKPSIETCNGKDDNCDNQIDNISLPEPCEVKNAHGTCVGVLHCDPAKGAGTCDAKTPEPELCDGLDNNCDGVADDASQDGDKDGLADCVDDDDDNDTILDTADNCPINANTDQVNTDGDPQGDACDKDDDNDNVPDAEDCAPLNTKVNPKAQEICDDLDNDCDGETNEGLCDDGKECTNDKCQTDGSCVHTPNKKACDDQTVCTQTSVCVGGKCVGSGFLNCDDNNACTDDWCDPANGCQHKNNAVACDDQNACTENDYCKGGKCVAGPFVKCNDNNPCTQDNGCSPLTGCQYNPISGPPCNTGDSQCGQGTCQFGQCISKDGVYCKSGAGKCPEGVCNGGSCVIKQGQICTAKYEVDLCSDVEVPGVCTSGGNCVAQAVPSQYSCPGCPGLCVKCFIQLCIPIF